MVSVSSLLFEVFVQTMQAAKATPGILKMCGSQKLLDQLIECNKLLESVQKVRAALLVQMCSSIVCSRHQEHLLCIVWVYVSSSRHARHEHCFPF